MTELAPFPPGPFDIIYVDPPWQYEGTQHGGPGITDTGGAHSHYPTMTQEEMCAMPVRDIAAKDCLLFMWMVSPKLPEAIGLGLSWGFKWVTLGFVWDKVRVNPGNYTMSQVELCGVFKRGRIPSPRGERNITQLVTEKRGRHSAKPDEVRRRIDRMFPTQRKLEMFCREPQQVALDLYPDPEGMTGWTLWGNEVLEPCSS